MLRRLVRAMICTSLVFWSGTSGGQPSAIATPGSAPAVLNSSIVFYAGFDRGSPNADLARGRSSPLRIEGTPTFVPGRFGRAILLGVEGGGSRITYDGEEHIDLGRGGSISFWVRPVSWIGAGAPKRGYVKFVTVPARPGSFVIQRMGFNRDTRRPDRLVAGAFDLPNIKRVYLQLPGTQSWNSEEWHLIVVTWDQHGLSLSLDGGPFQRREAVSGFDPEAFVHEGRLAPFVIGDPRGETSAMDELTVYSHALEIEDVRRLYELAR